MRRMTILVLFLYAGLTVYAVLRQVQKAPYLPVLTPLLTLLAFAFAVLHASQRSGWKRMLLLLGLSFGISLLFESIGVKTGLVYGPYHYTDQLGTKFLGLVPYLIPVAWFMMMYPSLVMAETLYGYNETTWQSQTTPTSSPPQPAGLYSILEVSAIGGLIMTAWDLVLDPTMVASGQWVWDGVAATRPYFGVPLQNFFGWWLTTMVTFSLYLLISRRWKAAPQAQAVPPRPVSLLGLRHGPPSQSMLMNWGFSSSVDFDRLVVISYLTSGVGIILTALLAGIQGPALVGIFAMSPWVIVVWPKLKELVQ